jgi:hypothetical protein
VNWNALTRRQAQSQKFYRLRVHYAILATLDFNFGLPSSAVRVFSLGSFPSGWGYCFSGWWYCFFGWWYYCFGWWYGFALVGGTVTSVGGTIASVGGMVLLWLVVLLLWLVVLLLVVRHIWTTSKCFDISHLIPQLSRQSFGTYLLLFAHSLNFCLTSESIVVWRERIYLTRIFYFKKSERSFIGGLSKWSLVSNCAIF